MNDIDASQVILCDLPTNPLPEGAVAGYFTTSDGVRLRYAHWRRKGESYRGTVCLVQGRTEFIEKYFETIEDFRRRGFAVATFDWRGQGGSERLIRNKRHGYVESFDDYWCDLRSFREEILLPDLPPPFYLVGHSMGGLVCLYAGINDRMMFDRIFVTSPMVGLDRQPFGSGGMAALAETLCFFGLGSVPIARPADRPPSEASFAGNPVTSDKTRFMRTIDVWRARPDLMITAPTVRWSAAAFRAMAGTSRDGFPGRVRVPVLMLAAGQDRVVSTSAIEQLGVRMRTGRHMVIGAAKHELLMETDAIREQVLAAFDAFVTEQSE